MVQHWIVYSLMGLVFGLAWLALWSFGAIRHAVGSQYKIIPEGILGYFGITREQFVPGSSSGLIPARVVSLLGLLGLLVFLFGYHYSVWVQVATWSEIPPGATKILLAETSFPLFCGVPFLTGALLFHRVLKRAPTHPDGLKRMVR